MPKPPAEAYPALDAATLEARFRTGERYCEWTYDDTIVGHVFLKAVTEHSISFSSHFRGFAHIYPTSGIQLVQLAGRQSKNVSRPWFVCKGCNTARSKLFLVRGEWGCRVCFALEYRSTREGSLARLWREKDKLSLRLGAGRPKRMRVGTYEALLARLERVTQLIKGRIRPRNNDALGLIIEAKWSNAKPVASG